MEKLHALSDEKLLHGLVTLVGTQRETLARMIAFLREVDARAFHATASSRPPLRGGAAKRSVVDGFWRTTAASFRHAL